MKNYKPLGIVLIFISFWEIILALYPILLSKCIYSIQSNNLLLLIPIISAFLFSYSAYIYLRFKNSNSVLIKYSSILTIISIMLVLIGSGIIPVFTSGYVFYLFILIQAVASVMMFIGSPNKIFTLFIILISISVVVFYSKLSIQKQELECKIDNTQIRVLEVSY